MIFATAPEPAKTKRPPSSPTGRGSRGDFPAAPERPGQFQITAEDLTRLRRAGIVTGEAGRVGLVRREDGRALYDPAPEMRVRATGFYDDLGLLHEIAQDATVKGVLNHLIRSIARAKDRLATPPDATPEEIPVYAFLQRYFGLDGTLGWLKGGRARLKRLGLRSLTYGFAIGELIWDFVEWAPEGEQPRSYIVPTKIKERAPQSLYRILWDENDEILGIQQITQSDKAASVEPVDYVTLNPYTYHEGDYEIRTIPAEKLIWWTHDERDGNPTGVALIRAAWRYVEFFQETLRNIARFEAVAIGGVTVVKELINQNTGDRYECVTVEDWNTSVEVAAAEAQGDVSVRLETAGIETRKEFPKQDLNDRRPYLDFLRGLILSSLSSALMGLDSSHAGSASLSGQYAQMLQDAIEAIGEDIVEVIVGTAGTKTDGLIRKIVEANFDVSPAFRYPTWTLEGIKTQNLPQLVDMLTKAQQFRLYTPGARDEAWVRSLFGAPEHTEEEIEEMREAQRSTPTRETEENTQAPQAGPAAGDMA